MGQISNSYCRWFRLYACITGSPYSKSSGPRWGAHTAKTLAKAPSGREKQATLGPKCPKIFEKALNLEEFESYFRLSLPVLGVAHVLKLPDDVHRTIDPYRPQVYRREFRGLASSCAMPSSALWSVTDSMLSKNQVFLLEELSSAS